MHARLFHHIPVADSQGQRNYRSRRAPRSARALVNVPGATVVVAGREGLATATAGRPQVYMYLR